MKIRTLVVEIAIGAVIVALGVWLSVDGATEPAPIRTTGPVVTPPPAPPKPSATPILSVRDDSVLCLDTRCRRIARYYDAKTSAPRYRASEVSLDAPTRLGDCALTLGGTLTCGHDAPLHVEVTWGRGQTYLRDGDRLAWLVSHDSRTSPDRVHWMPAFRDGIQQLAIGFRIGCVLTRAHSVWCWSDPAAPVRAIKVPAHVVEIAVTELFGLCVRTEAGQVWCTPGTDDTDLACDPSGATCGVSHVIEETKLEHAYDPVVMLMRPLRRIDIPQATRLVAGEYWVDIGQITPEHPRDRYVPTCTIGRRGEVTCFSTCPHGGVAIFHVTGVPAAREVRSDLDRSYVVTETGELWSWMAPLDRTCGTSTVKAIQDRTPPIIQLGPPLYHMGPYPRIETTRCAVTRGGTRCWQDDPVKLDPIVGFDPTTL